MSAQLLLSESTFWFPDTSLPCGESDIYVYGHIIKSFSMNFLLDKAFSFTVSFPIFTLILNELLDCDKRNDPTKDSLWSQSDNVKEYE